MTDYEKKILLVAAEICELYSCKIANSSCDDWEGEKLSFTKEETQSLLYNYQLVNSEGEDYDPKDVSISSGVLLGSAIGQALLKIAEGQEIASPPIQSPLPENPANHNGDDWEESQKPCPDCGQLLWTADWYDDPPEDGGANIGTLEKCGNCGYFDTF